MTINELVKKINENSEWSLDEYEEDFEIRLIPLHARDGKQAPFFEVEGKTEYGGYNTIYYDANQQPIALSDFITKEEMKKYNIRNREGMAIPKEFLSFLDV